jgi:AcrR family transcriptional regulator
MMSKGLSGVTVDAVASECGVAKTTIYRHWPKREALLLDACAQLRAKMEPPDTGSLRGDLTPLLMGVATRLRTGKTSSAWISIIDAAERDPQLAEQQAKTHGDVRQAFATVVERAQRRGEISRSKSPAEVIAFILGPIFYRRWFSREPIDERFVKQVIDRVIADADQG